MQTQIQSEMQQEISVPEMAAGEAEFNAVTFLSSQHREVELLFSQLEGTSDRAVKKRESLLTSLVEKLAIHTKIEEGIFYPAALDADDELVLEALEEHANVKAMVRKLQKISGGDETFKAKIKVLKELVRHHVHEEENELFPKCQSALGEERLKELGEELRAKFDRLQGLH